jgi:hypothetical protein
VREPELSRAAHAWYLLCHGVAGGSAVGDARGGPSMIKGIRLNTQNFLTKKSYI